MSNMRLKSIQYFCSVKVRFLEDFITDSLSAGFSISYSMFTRYRQDLNWLYDLGYLNQREYDDYVHRLDDLFTNSPMEEK